MLGQLREQRRRKGDGNGQEGSGLWLLRLPVLEPAAQIGRPWTGGSLAGDTSTGPWWARWGGYWLRCRLSIQAPRVRSPAAPPDYFLCLVAREGFLIARTGGECSSRLTIASSEGRGRSLPDFGLSSTIYVQFT